MSERPKTPSFEIPDLELAAPVSKRPTQESGARLAAATAPPALADDDDFELIPTGASLEVEKGLLRDIAPRATDTAPWPTGRSRAFDQLPIDSAAVARVADYGDAPRSAVLSPLYAYRVYTRRAPLKSAIATSLQELQQAEAERDTALMQLSEQLRPVLTDNEVFRRLLEPIGEVERLASDRSAALAEADQGLHAEMAKFDEQLALLRQEEQLASARVAERQTTADAAEQVLRRAEAKLQRIQIEMRGVVNLARQALGPAGGDLPAPQAARLAELQARANALEPLLGSARSVYDAESQQLNLAQAGQKRTMSTIKQLEHGKSSASSTFEKHRSASAAGVSDAARRRRDALADVARAVLAARGSVAVSEPVLEILRSHDRKVEAAAIRLETHVRALGSHDAQRTRQGVILVLSGLAALVLLILLKAML